MFVGTLIDTFQSPSADPDPDQDPDPDPDPDPEPDLKLVRTAEKRFAS